MNIYQFRREHPEYGDMDDVELATKLHAKSYSDMPKEQFFEAFEVVVPDSRSIYEQQAEKDSIYDNTMAGIGGGMTSMYEGAKQLVGLGDEEAIQQHKDAMAGLNTTGGGMVGDIIGQTAATFPAMMVGGATLPGAAAIGAGVGALQPVTEDESRLANMGMGGIGGAAGKYLGDKVSRMMQGNPNAGLNSAEQRALDAGQDMGFRQTPGYATGSKGLQKVEARMESNPLTSRAIESVQENNQKVMNQVAAKSLGETSDTLDSEVLGTVKRKISDTYNKVADDSVRQIDPDDVIDRLVAVADKSEGVIPKDLLDDSLTNQLYKFAAKGEATGKQLQQLSSKLNKQANKNMTTPMGDRDLGIALFEVKDIVDDYLGSGLAPDLAEEFAGARKRYRTLMQLTSRNNIVNPASGNVKPVALSNYLQKKDPNGYLYGGNSSDLYNAARFGQAFQPIVGNSGTATRSGQGIIESIASLPMTAIARAYTSKPSTSLAQAFQGGLLHAPESVDRFIRPATSSLGAAISAGLLDR